MKAFTSILFALPLRTFAQGLFPPPVDFNNPNWLLGGMAPRENLGILNLVNNLAPPPAPNLNLFPPRIDINNPNFGGMAPRENLGIPNLVNNFPGLVPPPAPNSNLFPPPIDIKYAPPASFSGGAREVNDATVKLVKNFESFVPSPAPDPYGFLTVGYGHRCQKPGCGEVRQEFPLTPKTASELMRGDLSRFEKCITRALADSNVQLTDNQYGALVSLAYNAGEKGVSSSNLIKRLRAGEDPNTVIEQEMPDWKRSGGKISQGLINRRKREIEFFKEG